MLMKGVSSVSNLASMTEELLLQAASFFVVVVFTSRERNTVKERLVRKRLFEGTNSFQTFHNIKCNYK